MKKILLLLNLIAFTAISQVTPVGGYLPLNSTKSATMGGLRVNGNETVTGTFSVGSAAIITGNTYMGQNASNTTTLGGVSMGYNTSSGIMHFGKYSATSNAIWGYHSSTPTTSNYNLNFDANNAYFNSPSALFLVTNGTIRASYGTSSSYNTLPLRVGSNSAPTATLDVTGDAKVSSTFSLGSANLTGGNTGTVAVLSDAIGYINHAYTTGNFANNQSYIMDDCPTAVKLVLASRNYLPKAVTFNQYNASIYVLGTPGSGGTTGTLVLQVNGVNTNTVNTALTFTSGVNTFSGTLTQTVAAGSYISTLLMTPNFTTNPTNVMPAVQWWYRQ